MKKCWSIILTLALLASMIACQPQAATTWQEQYDLGVRYLSEGNYEEAIIAFTAAIEIDPMRAEAYIGRGDAYARSGDSAENLAAALSDYEKALELDDKNADAYLALADIYIRQGNFDTAIEILKRGFERTNGNQKIADQLEQLETNQLNTIVRIEMEPGKGEYYTKEYDAYGDIVRWIAYTYPFLGAPRKEFYPYLIRYAHSIYDEAGNAVRTEYYDQQDIMTSYSVREYDDGVIMSATSYGMSHDVIEHTVCEYDSDGNMTCTSYRADGSIWEYYTEEYDVNGNVLRYAHYSENGDSTESIDYTYDSNGKLISKRRQFYSTSESCLYEYDADGKLVREVITPTYGDTYNILYTYTGSGKLLHKTQQSSDGSVDYSITYEYDDRDNMVGAVYYEPYDSFEQRYTYQYDEAGRQTVAIAYDANGNVAHHWER